MKWSIVGCDDCQEYFAVTGRLQDYCFCPYCSSDETTGTGEYLSSNLYAEDGKVLETKNN